MAQSFKDFELLILDDGSTNDIEKTVSSFKDERIKFKKQEHKGVSLTRNALLDWAKGKYGAWCDSDDISLPDRFQIQYDFLNNNPDVSLVGGLSTSFNEKGDISVSKARENLGFLEYEGVCQGTLMFRLDDLNRYNLRYNPEFPILEDPEFFSRIFRYLKAKNILIPLIKYRVLENSLSHIPSNKPLKEKYGRIFRANVLNYLSQDLKTQLKISNALRKTKFIEKIFSCTSIYLSRKKYKLITILGFQILIKTNKKI